MRVLMVEDDEVLLDGLKTGLSRSGQERPANHPARPGRSA